MGWDPLQVADGDTLIKESISRCPLEANQGVYSICFGHTSRKETGLKHSDCPDGRTAKRIRQLECVALTRASRSASAPLDSGLQATSIGYKGIVGHCLHGQNLTMSGASSLACVFNLCEGTCNTMSSPMEHCQCTQ